MRAVVPSRAEAKHGVSRILRLVDFVLVLGFFLFFFVVQAALAKERMCQDESTVNIDAFKGLLSNHPCQDANIYQSLRWAFTFPLVALFDIDRLTAAPTALYQSIAWSIVGRYTVFVIWLLSITSEASYTPSRRVFFFSFIRIAPPAVAMIQFLTHRTSLYFNMKVYFMNGRFAIFRIATSLISVVGCIESVHGQMQDKGALLWAFLSCFLDIFIGVGMLHVLHYQGHPELWSLGNIIAQLWCMAPPLLVVIGEAVFCRKSPLEPQRTLPCKETLGLEDATMSKVSESMNVTSVAQCEGQTGQASVGPAPGAPSRMIQGVTQQQQQRLVEHGVGSLAALLLAKGSDLNWRVEQQLLSNKEEPLNLEQQSEATTGELGAHDTSSQINAKLAGGQVDNISHINTNLISSSAAQTTGVTDPAQTTGVTDPAQTTGVTDPAQTTGVTDPAQTTGVTDPAQTTGVTDPAQTTGVTDPSGRISENSATHMQQTDLLQKLDEQLQRFEMEFLHQRECEEVNTTGRQLGIKYQLQRIRNLQQPTTKDPKAIYHPSRGLPYMVSALNVPLDPRYVADQAHISIIRKKVLDVREVLPRVLLGGPSPDVKQSSPEPLSVQYNQANLVGNTMAMNVPAPRAVAPSKTQDLSVMRLLQTRNQGSHGKIDTGARGNHVSIARMKVLDVRQLQATPLTLHQWMPDPILGPRARLDPADHLNHDGPADHLNNERPEDPLHHEGPEDHLHHEGSLRT